MKRQHESGAGKTERRAFRTCSDSENTIGRTVAPVCEQI